MKTFFSSIFINKEGLEEVGIFHPIKLEYYKIIHEDEIMRMEKAKFGIHVIKTEYKDEGIEVENKKLFHISNDESKIEEILHILKRNEVSTITVEEIVTELINA